ncbi:MAG: winged helix-turn-helix domain-containing protein, partial [bacterium]|nr:winged helix-turn-helix domain-containing protein [bacterium]
PRDDGFVLCSRLRAVSDVPIIILSSRAKESDRAAALEPGVEYLMKPFGIGELMVRVRAILRRVGQYREIGNGTYEFDELSVDLGARLVTSRGKRVMLTPTEFALLSVFVRNAGKVLTHRYVLEAVWGSAFTEEREYLRAYVYNLRRKIEPNVRVPRHILNAPGVGYQFAPAIGNQHVDVLASTSSAS